MSNDIVEISYNEVPEIAEVRPFGSQILVEILKKNEVLQAGKIHIPDSLKKEKDDGAPQAYIVALGPKVDPTLNLAVGMRVVVTGVYIPMPVGFSRKERVLAAIEPHAIRAILSEKK